MLMFLCQLSLYDWTNCMNHMITEQIECRSNFCLTCRFFVSLFHHHIITIIPKLRKARTINPEKEPSAIRKESVQLTQTRTTEAKRMEPCTARGMLPQRFRQPGAADASITPSAKSPNMYGLGHARESSHRCRNRQNRHLTRSAHQKNNQEM